MHWESRKIASFNIASENSNMAKMRHSAASSDENIPVTAYENKLT